MFRWLNPFSFTRPAIRVVGTVSNTITTKTIKSEKMDLEDLLEQLENLRNTIDDTNLVYDMNGNQINTITIIRVNCDDFEIRLGHTPNKPTMKDGNEPRNSN